MSDKPPRSLKPADDPGYEVIDGPGYEVVEPPAAQPPVARARVVARAVPPPPVAEPLNDEDDPDNRPARPVKRSAARPAGWVGRNRTVLFWGGVSAALGLLVLVAGVVTPVIRDWADKPPPPSAPVPRPPVAPPRVPAGWQEYSDHLAAYVVWAPAGVAGGTVDLSRVPAAVGATRPRAVRWDHAGLTYLLSVTTMPPGQTPPGEADGDASPKTMTGFMAGMRNSLGLRNDPFGGGKSQSMVVGGHRGAASSDTLPDGRAVHIRATLFGGVAYSLVVTGPAGLSAADPTVAPFFDGFRLTPGASPPAGATAPPSAAAPPAPEPAPGANRPPRATPAQPAPPPEKPADLGPPPAPAPRPDGWTEFTDPQGAFLACLPAGPAPASQAVQEWGATTVKPRGWAWERGGLTYHLIAVEEWPKPRANAPPKTDAQADRANQSHLGWLSSYVAWAGPYRPAGSPRPVWLAGRRAAASTRTEVGGKTVLHLRGLVADGAGYYLAVVGPAGLADTAPEVAGFFDGFRLAAGAEPKGAGRPKAK